MCQRGKIQDNIKDFLNENVNIKEKDLIHIRATLQKPKLNNLRH